MSLQGFSKLRFAHSHATMSSSTPSSQACKLILHGKSTQCSSSSASRTTHPTISASKLQRVHPLGRMQRGHRQSQGAACSPIFAVRPHRRDEPQGNSEPPTPLTDLVQTFYSCINEKDLTRLRKLISQDCIFEDMTYSRPFIGKMIHEFFKKLTGAMGGRVKFVTDDISEGEDLTTTVLWHLEWKNYCIPLTKGCSFFKCSREGNLLLIKEAHVFVESPIKPGELSLGLLRTVVFLSDNFPKLTERFLRKPDAVLHFMVKLYKLLLEPAILPIMFYYGHLWRYVAATLSFVFYITGSITKRFL